MRTEHRSPRYSAIDLWEPADILDAMIEGQFAAVAAVHAARPALERAALAIEQRLRAGGRLVYAGAGTSGRLAVQDGAELMPTFSWPAERLVLLMAGGRDALLRAVEGAEDEAEAAALLVERHQIGAGDALAAVAASGTTPFTLACLRAAAGRGALTVGIANNANTPILDEADHPRGRGLPGHAWHDVPRDHRPDLRAARPALVGADRLPELILPGRGPRRTLYA